MEISITAQVQAKRDALAFTQFTAPPDFHNTKMLREEPAIFLSAFPCNKWGGGIWIHPDGLIRRKMELLTTNAALDCTSIAKTDLVNPVIVAKTSRDLVNLQEEQLGLWSDYL